MNVVTLGTHPQELSIQKKNIWKIFCKSCRENQNKIDMYNTVRKRKINNYNYKLTLDNNIKIFDYILEKEAIKFYCSDCDDFFTYHRKRVPNNISCRNCNSGQIKFEKGLKNKFLLVSDYKYRDKKSRYKVTLKHLEDNCNFLFEINSDVNPSKITCPKCTHEIKKLNFPKELKNKYENEFELISDYINLESLVTISHNNDYCKGKPFNAKAGNFLRYGVCQSCKEKKSKIENSFDYVSKRINFLLGDTYSVVKETFIDNKNFQIKHTSDYCKNHVYERELSYFESRRGGCPICSKAISINERKIMDILKKQDIYFEREKIFSDFRFDTGGYPRYDFYVFYKDKKYLIEYDGEHHFQETNKWKTPLKDIQKRDYLKTKYAQDKGIPLLRVSYKEQDIIEKIIVDFLNKKDTF